jgi:multiple sugar transport system substrate-binding protein
MAVRSGGKTIFFDVSVIVTKGGIKVMLPTSKECWRRSIFVKTVYGLSLCLIMVFTLSGLSACGGSGGSGNGAVTLRYALWQVSEQPGYQQSINEFEKLHPNIHVQIEQTSWTQYWQKLDTEFAAQDAPDVFWDHVAYFPQFVQQQQLMDLTPMIQKDKLDLSIYYPSLLKQFQYKGHYYGLPKDWDTIALVYNKNIFQKAGLPAPTNLTWNPTDGGTFLQLAQKLTVDKNGLHPNQAGFNPGATSQYGFVVAASSPQETYWNFIAMNGGQYLDQPFGQHFVFNQPKSEQALQFLVDLMDKWHVAPPGTETTTGLLTNGPTQFFSRGNTAMVMAGSWNLAYLQQQVNFPFGIVEIPSGPAGRISMFNGLSDAIYAHTQHPQEAWELFKWLASPQSQKIVGGGGYVWPAIQSLAPLFAQYWQSKGLDVSAYLEESKGQTVSFPLTPAYNEAQTKIDDELNLALLGRVPMSQAVGVAVQQGDQAISANASGS